MTSTSEPNPETALIENRRVRLERLLQIASHDFDLRFDFGNRDLIGESQIVLKASPKIALNVSISLLKGRALNLLGHSLAKSWELYDAAVRQESQGKHGFATLWHALEDARVENWFLCRYPGAIKFFEANMLPNMGGNFLRRMHTGEQCEIGLYLEGRGYRGARYADKVRQVLDEVAADIYEGAHGGSPNDSYQAMLRIFPVIADVLELDAPWNPKQRERNASEQVDDNETEEGQGVPQGASPEFIEEDGLFSVPVQGERREFPEWFRPGSAPWFERDLGKKEIHPSALRTSRQTIVEPPKGDLDVYRALRSEIRGEVGFLANRLTNLIREEIYLRYAGYYRTGRLNKAKLWKQRIGNYRLFQRMVSGVSQMVAFTILVDESASMKGQEKYKLAAKAAILLGEALHTVGSPFEIIGYTTQDYEARAALKLGLVPAYQYRTTRCSPLEHRIYKRFDEPFPNVRIRLTGIEPRHNNWDEEHLWFAFQRLQARSERHKVIIVIGDGQPNGDANYLIETVKRIESAGCSLIGVGIGADYVRQIYSRPIVESDFRQLTQGLFQVLAAEFRSR